MGCQEETVRLFLYKALGTISHAPPQYQHQDSGPTQRLRSSSKSITRGCGQAFGLCETGANSIFEETLPIIGMWREERGAAEPYTGSFRNFTRQTGSTPTTHTRILEIDLEMRVFGRGVGSTLRYEGNEGLQLLNRRPRLLNPS